MAHGRKEVRGHWESGTDLGMGMNQWPMGIPAKYVQIRAENHQPTTVSIKVEMFLSR